MVIIFKKGNTKNLTIYRLIYLLSNIYKVSTKGLTNRLEKTLDENQQRELAGFRSRYSNKDHIDVVNQAKEKCTAYNIPFSIALIAFVYYEKTFDSVQIQAVLTSLQEQGIEDLYIEILKEIYTISSMALHDNDDQFKRNLHKESNKINNRREVRQGYTISPNLFPAALESIIQRLTWETRGLKMDGEYLSHLRFADDILTCANTPHELQQMHATGIS